MEKVIFRVWMAPGDVIVSTVAIRELHRCYPEKYIVSLLTPYPEITFNNPRIADLKQMMDNDTKIVDLTYADTLFNSTWSGKHFSDGFIDNINEQMELNITKLSMYPELYMMDKELKRSRILRKYNIKGKYWLINTGFKMDIGLKAYPTFYWEEIIKLCKERNIQLIQVGSKNDLHPSFENVRSLVGQTENLRDFLSLCAHAEGAITPISMLMHTMAAFRKPCVVLAGGRETPNWEMYPKHVFLHTVGFLSCCKDGGCWRKQQYECANLDNKYNFPKCMLMIEPNSVVNAIVNYNNIIGV